MPQDRIDSLAERAIKWASLSRKKNADKKLAVTVFSFPPDKGNVGTAAYLNVFGSIYRVLKVPDCCLQSGAVGQPSQWTHSQSDGGNASASDSAASSSARRLPHDHLVCEGCWHSLARVEPASS